MRMEGPWKTVNAFVLKAGMAKWSWKKELMRQSIGRFYHENPSWFRSVHGCCITVWLLLHDSWDVHFTSSHASIHLIHLTEITIKLTTRKPHDLLMQPVWFTPSISPSIHLLIQREETGPRWHEISDPGFPFSAMPWVLMFVFNCFLRGGEWWCVMIHDGVLLTIYSEKKLLPTVVQLKDMTSMTPLPRLLSTPINRSFRSVVAVRRIACRVLGLQSFCPRMEVGNGQSVRFGSPYGRMLNLLENATLP